MDREKEAISQAFREHRELLDGFEAGCTETIIRAARAITEAVKRGGRVFTCGNGGSAADAQHIAAELVGRFARERKAIPATALTTDSSAITAIANDYGYDRVFARQVEALLGKADVLWAISTSGGSPSIVAAAKAAKDKGAVVLAFTGTAGSQLEQAADICLCCGSASTARSQEMHQLAYHAICDVVEMSLCGEK
jgi:D-sedoheptulose 7-phosphate isomerase